MGGCQPKCILNLVAGSHGKARLRLEVINCPAEQLVHKASHIVRRKHQTALLVDQVAPTQGVVPYVGERVPQKPR